MKIALINLGLVFIISIGYMILSVKLLKPFFHNISKPMTNATGLLYFGVIFGFGLNLYDFSDIATSALHYYGSQQKLLLGVLYWFAFAAISFIFSVVIFYLSFNLMNYFTEENEKAELAKNNFVIAGVHLVVFIVICMLIAKPLTDFANTFISYSRMPD